MLCASHVQIFTFAGWGSVSGSIGVGQVGFSTGVGGSIESPKNGPKGGFGKRALDRTIDQLLWALVLKAPKMVLALKMVKFFFTKYMANDDFSEPPRRADSENPIVIFLPNFWSGSPPGPGCQSR